MKRIIVIMVLVLHIFNSILVLAEENTNKLPVGDVVMPVSYNIATKATAFAGDNGEYKNGENVIDDTMSAEKAIDGVISEKNAWMSAEDAKGVQTLRVDFDKPYILTGVSLFVNKKTDINDFSLKYISDGLQRDIEAKAEITERKNVARYPIDTDVYAEALVLTYPYDGSICVEEIEIYGYESAIITKTKADDIYRYYNDIEDPTLKNTLNRLCALNIMLPEGSDKFNCDENITRAEFTKEVLNLFAVKDSLNMTFDESSFNDVEKEHKYFNDIETAVYLGYIVGYNGEFRPNSNITFNEAVKILVTAAGYGDYAEANGGYPEGYLKAFRFMDVDVNSIIGENAITRSQMAVILDEMLDGRAIDDNFTVGEANIKKSEKTILNKYHDSYIDYGIVESVGKTTTVKDGKTSVDGIMISGKMYQKGELDFSENLGQSVKFIYKEVKDDDNKLLYMEVQKKNKVLDISGEDISGVKDYSDNEYELQYEIEENRTKKIRVPKSAAMVYDGDVVTPYPVEYLSPVNGTVRLIDNNGDGNYDIIIVTRLYGMCVHTVDYDGEYIYGLNDAVLDLGDAEYTIVNSQGLATLQDIGNDSVISYKRDSKDSILIYIIDTFISGTVEGVREDNKKSYVQIDGNEYKISTYYTTAVANGIAEAIEIGISGDFYIDKANEILWMEKNNTSDKYALLLKAYEEEDGKCCFRLIDNKGNKIVLEGKERIVSNIISGADKPYASELVEALRDVQTVVQIKRTNAGKLSEIHYCQNSMEIGNSDWNVGQKTIFTGVNVKNPFDRSSNKRPWNDDAYLLAEDGCVFEIEKDSKGKIKDNKVYVMPQNAYYLGTLYDVDPASRVFGAGLIVNVANYNVDESGNGEAMNSDNEGVQTYESFVFLNDGMYKNSENQERYMIRGYYKGVKKEFELNDNLSETSVKALSYGDVIALKLDKENKICSWSRVLDWSDDRTKADINASGSRGNWYQLNGYPSYIENGYMVIGKGIDGIPMTYAPALTAYIYDFDMKNVRVGTAAEITEGDYVLFNMYRFSLKDVLILKNYEKVGKE